MIWPSHHSSLEHRWKSSMARLYLSRLPDSKSQRKDSSGIVGKAAQGFCKDDVEGVLGDLRGKVQCMAWTNPTDRSSGANIPYLVSFSTSHRTPTSRECPSPQPQKNPKKQHRQQNVIPTIWRCHNRRPQDAPYASARWSLAVAHDVGSWRGGWRQRHYFGRLTAFLDYRRGRKAALRARVELRMVKRWATKHNNSEISFLTMRGAVTDDAIPSQPRR